MIQRIEVCRTDGLCESSTTSPQSTLVSSRRAPIIGLVLVIAGSAFVVAGCGVQTTDVTETAVTASISTIDPSERVDTSFVGDTIVYRMPSLSSSNWCGKPSGCSPTMKELGNFDVQWSSSDARIANKLGNAIERVPVFVRFPMETAAEELVVKVAALSPGEATLSLRPTTIPLDVGVTYRHKIVVLPTTPNVLDAPDVIVLAIGETQLVYASPRTGNGPSITSGVLLWGPTSPAVTPKIVELDWEGTLGKTQSNGQVISRTPNPITVRGVRQGQVDMVVSFKRAASTDMNLYNTSLNNAPPAPYQLQKTVRILVGASVRIVADPEGSFNDPSRALIPLLIGQTRQFRSLDQDNAVLPNADVQWQSLNAAVTITISGLATCVSPATNVVIRSTRKGTSLVGSTTMTCIAPPSPTLDVTPSTASVEVGQTIALTANVANVSGAVDVNWATPPTTTMTIVKTSPTTATLTGRAVTTAPVTVTATLQGTTVLTGTSRISVVPSTAPAIAIALSPAAVNVVQAGASATSRVDITRGGGFTGPVVVTASGAPAGLTVLPAIPSVAGNSVDLTISATTQVLPGTYPVSVSASSVITGTNSAPVTLSVLVTQAPGNAVVAVYFDPINAEITAPAGLTYRVKLLNALGNEVALSVDGGTLTYTSSNESAAKIAAVGSGLAIATGTQGVPSAGGGTESIGVTNILVRYTKNGQTVSAQTTLTVYKAGTAEHYGAVEILTPSDRRRLAKDEQMTVEVLVRDVNGIQMTNATRPFASLNLIFPLVPNAALVITPIPPLPAPGNRGYFFTIKAQTVTQPTSVDIRADLLGAAASIILIVTPP